MSERPKGEAIRVLVVDDVAEDRRRCVDCLAQDVAADYQCVEAETLEQALGRIDEGIDCILLSASVHEAGVHVLLDTFADRDGNLAVPLVLLTDHGDTATARTVRAGAQDDLPKEHVTPSTLGRTVRHAVARHDLLAELRAAHDRARHGASHCPLTGLPNRSLLLDRLEKAIAAAKRRKVPLGVLFIDLDGLKRVNDSQGHHVGDQLLERAADCLRGHCRDADTLARVGGDEFVLILTEVARKLDAGRVAQRLLEAMARDEGLVRFGRTQTASIGIAVYPEDGDNVGQILQRADAAMYRAKECGGDGYRFYSVATDQLAIQKLQMERELRRAVEHEQFRLRFAPRVEGETGRLVGLEAVVRWDHPHRGVVPPQTFMSVAEESNLLESIDLWMLGAVCRQAREWQQAGLAVVPITINIRARHLIKEGLVPALRDALEETGLPGRVLQLEVTEGCIGADAPSARRVLDEVRALGVQTTIGEFGTGSSSLGVLSRLSVETLKIDRGLISDLVRDRDTEVITAAVIALAASLGLEVVAEGVEEWRQLEFLLEHGCRIAQGPLFGPPVDDAQVRSWLRVGGIELKPQSSDPFGGLG